MPKIRALLCPLLLLSFALPVRGQVPSLLLDVNPGPADLSPGDLGGPGSWLVAAGGRVFFPDRTDSSGTELWTSDGTPFGTLQVADLCAGPCGSQPRPAGVLGEVFLFVAETPGRLWRTDGTPAGTYRLSAEGVEDPPHVLLGGKLLFQLCPAHAPSCELWATDGTLAGTARLAAVGGEAIDLAVSGGKAFALIAGEAGGASLWTSDGTPAGTALVAAVAPDAQFLLPAGGRVVVWASSGAASEVWGSDGTAAGTGRLRQLGPDPGALQGLFLATSLGGRVYFAAALPANPADVEIWASDGTATGTLQVTRLSGAVPALFPDRSNALLLGGRLVFEATDPQGSSHLFGIAGIAGTPDSTVQLSSATVLGPLAAVGTRAVFLADDGVHGPEPWTSDGTPAGTALVRDTCPGACGALADPAPLPLAGSLFFAVGDTQGSDLWTSDGTAAGTRRFTDFGPSRPLLASPLLAAVGSSGRIFFAASDPGHGGELWGSDGRSGGTRRVTDVGRRQPSSDPAELTALGSRLLFTACDGTSRTVWTSDGTAAGTLPTADPRAASPCADTADRPRSLTAAGAAAGALYFLAGSGPSLTLWRSDGTPTGARPIFSFPSPLVLEPPLAAADDGLWFLVEAAASTQVYRARPTDPSPQPVYTLPAGLRALHSLAVFGGQAFFVADQAGSFYVFAANVAGTSNAADIRQLAGPVAVSLSGEPDAWFLRQGGSVLFGATDTSDLENPATSIWATDGTPAGTRVLHRFAGALSLPRPAAFQGALWFLDLPDAGSGAATELWRTDGTPAGTQRTATFPAVAMSDPVAAAGKLFFTAFDAAHGLELWASDGSSASAPLLDLLPGPEGSAPGALTAAGTRLFFTADDGVHGIELWTSDGTAAGTRRVDDLAPGGISSNPADLTVAGDRLYFAADDGLTGREPWSLPVSGAQGSPCVPGETRLCLAGGRFQVEVAWQDFQGRTGVGHTLPLTADTGAFWFFDPANVEAIVKVLDARTLNGAFWVFYGALSNVQYSLTVTDTATGLTRRYDNPAGQLASVGDTAAFGPQGAAEGPAAPKSALHAPTLVSARTDRAAATGSCTPGPTQLCLQGGRFAVTAVWKDFQGKTGTGTAVPLSSDTGYFWFFAPTNVEVVTKVLDGTGLNGKFWFFYGALSNVEYTLTVTDTRTGAVKMYRNPSGRFGSLADTGAF